MRIKPIPDTLLGDNATLIIPEGSGFIRIELSNIRAQRKSSITDYSAGQSRDTTELTVYFDCNSSEPVGMEFTAGEQLEYRGEVYEIIEVKLFAGEAPHHWRLVGRKIHGAFDW